MIFRFVTIFIFLINLKGWAAKEPVTNGQPVLSSQLAIRQG